MRSCTGPCNLFFIQSCDVLELTQYMLKSSFSLQLADGELKNSSATDSVSGLSFVRSQKAANEVRESHKM
ncbi:hypothetical protein CesoFtcFv8_022497 [Champsocephalus esox]|uniref:Uncharacterized protein n=1 Tax=Champsocephalus esox TaxID=159716 RepID=A0AAN8BBP4_9TELE|nr:hypothetical protein CesoFtcFv8_022497 [Champsocephalus esox]